jgi:hypothetical protein
VNHDLQSAAPTGRLAADRMPVPDARYRQLSKSSTNCLELYSKPGRCVASGNIFRRNVLCEQHELNRMTNPCPAGGETGTLN